MNPVPVYCVDSSDFEDGFGEVTWESYRFFIPFALEEVDTRKRNKYFVYTYDDGTFEIVYNEHTELLAYTEELPWEMWKDFLKNIFEKGLSS